MDDALLSKYKSYMQEVKSRNAVIASAINHYVNGGSLTGYRESDIELCLLQLRKCLELIMYGSLVAHYHAGITLQSQIYKGEWNASKILKYISRVNPKGYPKAVKQVRKPGLKVIELENVDGALTFEEFGILYDRVCGKYLHASRNLGVLSNHGALFSEIDLWFSKLILLLNEHWIEISDDLMVATIMQSSDDGEVQVFTFGRVKT